MTASDVLMVAIAVLMIALTAGLCAGLALAGQGYPLSGSTLAAGCGCLMLSLCTPLGEEDDRDDDHDTIY